MSDLEKVLDTLVAGNEQEAQTMFKDMIKKESEAIYSSIETKPETPFSPVDEAEEHTYTVVHAKHGKEEIKASSSYGAAKKYAEMKKLKGTSGVDAHLHTKEIEEAVPEQEQTNEDEHSAVMDILAKHPAEYKALKDGESLYDQANLFDALFQYFSATGDMPYGTQKARDGDPYEWIEDKLDDLDLLENVAEEETASSRQDLESSLNNLYNILTTINSDDQSDALQSKEEELMADELIGTIAEFKARIEGDVGSFADESVEESAEDASRLLKSVIEDALDEAKKKPIPTSPDKWSRAKAKARSKFDVYPSAYANAYAAKEYKKMGGGWRMGKKKKK